MAAGGDDHQLTATIDDQLQGVTPGAAPDLKAQRVNLQLRADGASRWWFDLRQSHHASSDGLQSCERQPVCGVQHLDDPVPQTLSCLVPVRIPEADDGDLLLDVVHNLDGEGGEAIQLSPR